MSYFEQVRAGDIVSTIQLGNNCKVLSVADAGIYPVLVESSSGRTTIKYTLEGKNSLSDKAQSAFYGKALPNFEPPPKPKRLPDWPVDTKVWVWNDNPANKTAGHFREFNTNGAIRCFKGGDSSFTTNSGLCQSWRNYELAEEEQEQ